MLKDILNITSLLNLTIQKKIYFIVFLVFIGITEVIGVFIFLPVSLLIFNKGNITEFKYYKKLTDLVGFEAQEYVLYALFFFMILYIAICIVRLLGVYINAKISNYVESELACIIVQKFLNQKYDNFLKYKKASLTHQVISELPLINSGVISPGINLIIYGSITFSIVLSLLFYDYKATIASFLVLAVVYLLIYKLIRPLSLKFGEIRTKSNAEKYTKLYFAENNLDYIQAIRIDKDLYEGIAQNISAGSKSQTIATLLAASPKFLIEVIVFLMLILTLIIGFNSESRGLDSFGGTIIVLIVAGYRLLPSMQMIYSSLSQIRHYKSANRIILEYINSLSAQRSETSANIKNSSIKIIKALTLENIIYKIDKERTIEYPKSIIFKKELVNIIQGSSGCGKSTLVRILMGLLNPAQGKIYIDNNIVVGPLYNQLKIAYVTQINSLSKTFLWEILGLNENLCKDEKKYSEIVDLLRDLKLHVLISNSGKINGDIIIGEGGVVLSGGEMQRLQIAKEIIGEPDILILDEATSALDVENAGCIYSILAKLSKKIMIISISHDILDTLGGVNKINLTN